MGIGNIISQKKKKKILKFNISDERSTFPTRKKNVQDFILKFQWLQWKIILENANATAEYVIK